jgi:hypothetical protein
VEEEPFHIALIATLRDIVEKAEPYVTKQQYKWLMQPIHEKRDKVPVLKVIPKIHKLPLSGRPIVPTFDTLLANASVWVDYQLKPLLKEFPWILPDSKTFCREILEVMLPPGEDIWLVTGDVVAMYPNIPMDDGIANIASILHTSEMKFTSYDEASSLKFTSRKQLIILLLRLVLKFNYVQFADKIYRQVIGTAMGTATAPTYANLFLALSESGALRDLKDIILFYKRFIDDIFAIIKGTREDVQRFQDRFGSLHPSMKMEWTVSQLHLPFLDVQVSLGLDPAAPAFCPRRCITTNVYQKALNAYLYIPWRSCHSLDSKRAWVKGELIRYVRLCSNEVDSLKIRTDFVKRLRDRGYPGKWLRSVIDEIQYKVERPRALKSTEPKNLDDDCDLHVLKLTHNPTWDGIDLQPVWRELGDAWNELGAGYPKFRFLASFKKPVSLGDRLNKVNRDTLEAYHEQLAENV